MTRFRVAQGRSCRYRALEHGATAFAEPLPQAAASAQEAVQFVGLVIATTTAAAATGIWRGIRAMVRASKECADVLDHQRQADERRHVEAMAALYEPVRNGQRQAAALDELLRRTGPQPAE